MPIEEGEDSELDAWDEDVAPYWPPGADGAESPLQVSPACDDAAAVRVDHACFVRGEADEAVRTLRSWVLQDCKVVSLDDSWLSCLWSVASPWIVPAVARKSRELVEFSPVNSACILHLYQPHRVSPGHTPRLLRLTAGHVDVRR